MAASVTFDRHKADILIRNLVPNRFLVKAGLVQSTKYGSNAASFYMKKFLTFILFLIILIVAEYYFFIELFSQKRWLILLPSLLIVSLSIYGIFRFIKKTLITPKPSSSHN